MRNKKFILHIFILVSALAVPAVPATAQQTSEDPSGLLSGRDGNSGEIAGQEGRKEGVFKSYYNDGNLRSVGNYRAGKRDGLFKKFYENGQLMFKANYRADAIEGEIEMYDEEGNLIRKWEADEPPKETLQPKPSYPGIFPNDDSDAVFDLQKEYYKDGTLKAEKFYKNRKLEGIQKEYDRNGRLKQTLTYQDGELIDQEEYAGQDKSPLGSPTNLVECFAVLQRILTPQEVEQIKRAAPEELSDKEYFLKNKAWSLWTDTPLTDYFRDLGIYHPDDMGSIIFTSFQRFLNNEEMQLDKQIKHFQTFWHDVAEAEFQGQEMSLRK